MIRLYAPDMILNVHSNASYMSAECAPSHAGGYVFLRSMPQNGKPIQLNGNIETICTILKILAASANEAELGLIFVNTKETWIVRLISAELDHPQTPLINIHQ